VWTPKRVLLLGLGIGFFLFGYGVYAFFLGRIDGLAPLPADYLPGDVKEFPPEAGDDAINKKLRLAFGQECHQVKQPIKFEVRKKGMFVAASSAYFNEPDGRVKVTELSLALFKENAEFKFPEITTLQSDLAWLKFDKTIVNLTDMFNSKITGTELRGNIVIINNRHTPEKFDDLEVLVRDKPLYYDDRAGKIWTDGIVNLLDKQTRPKHTMIKGVGMEMLLAKEAQGEKKPAVPKVKSDLSGIDMIMLKSTVTMDLYTDSSSGFLSGTGKANGAPAGVKDGKLDAGVAGIKEPPKKTAAEKSHVHITTDGPFVYDVPKDLARFESPPSGGGWPDRINVIRTPISDEPDSKRDVWDRKNDQLDCDYLELKFVREAGTGASHDKTERKIESAHATARKGTEVVLSLDTENLACFCDDLKYSCATADRGAKTVLTGNPLKAAKDGHKIKAQELVLVQANQKGAGQSIVARGPGQVDLCDRDSDKGFTTHAIWKAFLTSTKYRVGEKEMDLLTLTEDAAFIDDEHQQKLYGQRLLLWLEPIDLNNQATPAVQPETGLAVAGSRQRPYQVEAYDRVSAQSPQLLVNDCTSLKIRFHDAPRAGMMLPDVLPGPSDVRKTPAAAPAAAGNASQAALGPTQARPGPQDPMPLGPPATSPNPPKQNEKPKEPINLVARDVVADVLRDGDKNDLQELVADGNVHVKQKGATPTDKGVDIQGEALKLNHFVEGDILNVYGNPSEPAELQLGELFLVAPKVNINQKTNSAWAEGVGAMNMPSNTTFDGGKPTKPGTRIVVHWTRDMIFEQGRDAEFHGGVVAYQDDATLQCKTLQVALDRPVSFKEGQKEGEQAKVEKIIAHGEVRVYEEAKDPVSGKFISSRHLFCTQLAVNNKDNIFVASGPGQAATLQFGETQAIGPNAGGNAPKQAAAPAKQPELQLTRINFQERMHSTVFPNTTTRQTTFTGKVNVLHLPADRLDATVDGTKLPKDAMILQCDQLKVLQRQLANNKTTQTTEASRNVSCWTIDIFGRAEVLTFDESTDIVTFKGSPGNPAQVYQKIGSGGSEPRESKAETILYNRKTGLVSGAGSSGFGGSSLLDPVDRWHRPAHDMRLVCQLPALDR
jgi:hypothetical protein